MGLPHSYPRVRLTVGVPRMANRDTDWKVIVKDLNGKLHTHGFTAVSAREASALVRRLHDPRPVTIVSVRPEAN